MLRLSELCWKDSENSLAGTHKLKNSKDNFKDDPYGSEVKKFYKTTSTIKGEKWSTIFGESEALMNKPVDLPSDVKHVEDKESKIIMLD